MNQDNPDEMTHRVLAVRSLFGGLLMGLANLVPGISGGTMLLAAGVYPAFIKALAELTRFRFRFRTLLVIGCVAVSAGMAILFFAGSMKELVLDHRWIMYSLFIGLTFGGLPILWQLARPATAGLIFWALVSFAGMIGLAALEFYGVMGTGSSNRIVLFLAGLAGASAMILPGISGGYILLLMGQYVPILSAVDEFKEALKARDLSAAMDPAFSILIPVGIGVVLGVAIVGNVLKWMLERFRKSTLGFLIGLLIGSVAGLWPFKIGVMPVEGDLIKGRIVTAEMIEFIEKKDWITALFSPTLAQIFGSLCLIAFGFAITQGIAAIGSSRKSSD